VAALLGSWMAGARGAGDRAGRSNSERATPSACLRGRFAAPQIRGLGAILDLPSRHLQAFVSSLHRLVYKTVVEGLPHVELLGFRMVDKFQRVRHCSLDHLERGRESTSVVFKATLQISVIVDSGKAPQRAFGGSGIFFGELLSFVQRA